jgi:predicted kinase
MRKWMRDKFKRRKKTQDEAPATKPAPLQPAYFQAEPETSNSTPESAVPDTRPGETEHAPGGDSSEPVAQTPEIGPRAQREAANPRPRRRRRGGRGRRRTNQKADGVAQAQPASIPAPPVAPSEFRKPSRGVVVLAIGLPGSGKSSWFKRHNITPLSSDMLRSLLFDDPAEQGFQDLVFSNLRSMLKARLLARRPLNYVDATNLTPHDRHSWIKLAKDYGYEVQAVFFDVPLEVCLERNHRRPRVVSDEVMRQMSAKLKAPSFDEGFAKITVVRVKQQSTA